MELCIYGSCKRRRSIINSNGHFHFILIISLSHSIVLTLQADIFVQFEDFLSRLRHRSATKRMRTSEASVYFLPFQEERVKDGGAERDTE